MHDRCETPPALMAVDPLQSSALRPVLALPALAGINLVRLELAGSARRLVLAGDPAGLSGTTQPLAASSERHARPDYAEYVPKGTAANVRPARLPRSAAQRVP